MALDGQGGIDNFGAVSGCECAGLDPLNLHAIKNNDIIGVDGAIVPEFNQLYPRKGVFGFFRNIKSRCCHAAWLTTMPLMFDTANSVVASVKS